MLTLRVVCVLYYVALVLGESETTTQTVSPSATRADHDPSALIDNLQDQLNDINVNEIRDSISSQGTELSNAKAELTKIGQRLSSFEQQETNLGAIQSALDSTNEAIDALKDQTSEYDALSNTVVALSTRINNMESAQNTERLSNTVQELSARVEKVESEQSVQQQALSEKSQKDDTSSQSAQSLESRIESLSSSMSREISDNAKRLDIIEESGRENELGAIKKSIQELSVQLETIEKRHNKAIKSTLDRITKLDEKIQAVYDSTLAAALDTIATKTLEYLDIFGDYLVHSMAKMRDNIKEIDWMSHWQTVSVFAVETWNTMKTKIQEVDWKGLYEGATDTKQLQLAKEWLLDLWQYTRFWWIEGIQPAIINQATNLYLGVQTFTKQSIEFVHSHLLYTELLHQLKPFLKMANIPEQYSGYILDGVLVLFCFSALMTLSFVLGMCCDCCCPRKPSETRAPQEERTTTGSNAIHKSNKRRKKSKR